MDKFKLCESAGLTLEYGNVGFTFKHVIPASEVEALLANAPMVYGSTDMTRAGMWANTVWPPDTHTARLVCISPIVRDTAEGLLRELVGAENASAIHAARIIERSRKLLEGK